jgi:tetratricopeptide (TPR) repeat protein
VALAAPVDVRWRRIGLIAAAALAAVCAVAVPLEARAWRDELTLWRHAADVEPDAALAQSNLGIALLRAHAFGDALVHLQAAQRIAGDGPALSMQIAIALEGLGRYDEAAAAAQRSLSQADSADGRAILARITAKAAASRR